MRSWQWLAALLAQLLIQVFLMGQWKGSVDVRFDQFEKRLVRIEALMDSERVGRLQ